jgi:hypothetical protein
MLAEMRSQGGVSFGVYRAYCAAGGNCGVTLLVFGVCMLAQFVFSLGDYWMSYWYVLLKLSGRIDECYGL